MRHASETLTKFGVAHESKVLSAHRTPHAATEYATNAAERGVQVMIAAAGGAAHLAGVMAAHTLLPVLGVPMESHALKGMDSLLSTVQMPAGIPVGTVESWQQQGGALTKTVQVRPFADLSGLNYVTVLQWFPAP